jgi:hypothetical protein
VNSRDLATLKVVPGRLDALASSLPAAVKRVAESGVATAADAARMAACGYDLALVGSALMSAEDPAQLAAPCSRRHARPWRSRRAGGRPRMSRARLHQDLRHDRRRRGQYAAMACEVDAIGFVFASRCAS